ncbi:hypothetical protein [Campylobacter ureolyticus]|uniref:hypothetical protein n=1 Tax=Campylobacter ureolyticus TaxID=827 RepID=UPI0022B5D6F4|nr:hypothetical protein [Campylobacter ureolyticus]MCZ6111031.1 hypothetical protein [Campylobacter ureolyticus]
MFKTKTTTKNIIVQKLYENIFLKSLKFDLGSPFFGKTITAKIKSAIKSVNIPKFGTKIILNPFIHYSKFRLKK